jgi:fatty-acyl-CoA synthase
LNERLARFEHPKDLIVLGEPRNASGKVVKGVLRENDRS